MQAFAAARQVKDVNGFAGEAGFGDHVYRIAGHDQKIGQRHDAEIGVFARPVPDEIVRAGESLAQDGLVLLTRAAGGGEEEAGAGQGLLCRVQFACEIAGEGLREILPLVGAADENADFRVSESGEAGGEGGAGLFEFFIGQAVQGAAHGYDFRAAVIVMFGDDDGIEALRGERGALQMDGERCLAAVAFDRCRCGGAAAAARDQDIRPGRGQGRVPCGHAQRVGPEASGQPDPGGFGRNALDLRREAEIFGEAETLSLHARVALGEDPAGSGRRCVWRRGRHFQLLEQGPGEVTRDCGRSGLYWRSWVARC